MSRWLSPDEMTVLSIVLRARPGTVAELERQGSLVGPRLRTALDGLEAEGFVRLDKDVIVATDPAEVVLAAASAELSQQANSLATVEAMLAQLPGLARDGWLGSTDRAGMQPVEVVHGSSNQWDLWMRLMGETPPRAPIAVFPDFGGLARIVIDNLDALRHARQQLGFSLRTVTVPTALANADERDQMEIFADVGVDLRTLAAVPSWFYVDDGVLAALPLEWGQAVPSSVALVREPALIAPLAAYADWLWQRAAPIPQAHDAGDAVLELLAQGLSDGAIAHTLGTSLRTVRRRISEATERHGVSSRFALGAEWERRRAGQQR